MMKATTSNFSMMFTLRSLNTGRMRPMVIRKLQNVIICTAILLGLAVECSLASPLPPQHDDVPALCAEFDERVEALDVKGARVALEKAYGLDRHDFEVLYRMARLHVFLGNEERTEDAQLAFYEKALDYANKAVAKNGKAVPGYLYRAAAHGKIALYKGVFSVASVVKSVRDDCWYALQLGNGTQKQMAGIHYILGRAHLELSFKPHLLRLPVGLGWGNIGEAHEHLTKARELRPGFIMIEYDYARCLVEMDRESEARKILHAIAHLKRSEPGDEERQREAVIYLKELD
jgi:tetratricopeptide (TPR) repeat protein